MSIFEHTRPLMNRLTNIYKSGGVKCNILLSSCRDFKRLSVPVWAQKVAFLVSVLVCLCACTKDTLIESYNPETEPYGESRSDSAQTEKPSIIFQLEDWGDDGEMYMP